MGPDERFELLALSQPGVEPMTRATAMPLLVAMALTVVVAGAGPTRAEGERKKVKVTVVDQAGSVVYLEPGEQEGVRPGQKVYFGKKSYRVVAITATSATIDVGKQVLSIGKRGTVTVTVSDKEREARPKPKSLDAYEGEWAAAVPPSEAQNPTPVPIGSIRRRGSSEVLFRATSSSLFPFGGGNRVTRVAVRAQLRAEPFADTPFGVDADLEVAKWIGRGLTVGLGADSRPLLEVHELRLRYGDLDNPLLGLGRLRYAAATVGLLDGVRVSSPTKKGITVYAFGGLVPNTLNGKPVSDVSRFGAGATYFAPTNALRPSAELTAHGSMFDGALDERRVAANVRMYPGSVSLGGRVEVSMFDKDNAWGASKVELTAAGVDAGVTHKRWRANVSVDALQPERSAWLASLLPPSWLCTASQGTPGVSPEPCDGNRDTRYFSLATTGFDTDRVSIRLGGNAVANEELAIDQVGGFADLGLHKLWRDISIDLGAMASLAPFVEMYALRAGLSSPLSKGVDASLFYRPALLVYDAATSDLLEHRVGGEVFYAPANDLGVRVSAEAATGDDVSVVGVYATAVWRASL